MLADIVGKTEDAASLLNKPFDRLISISYDDALDKAYVMSLLYGGAAFEVQGYAMNDQEVFIVVKEEMIS